VTLPGEERRCTAQDLVLLLQPPDPLPGIPEFGGLLLRHAGTGAVLDVGFLKRVVQGCFGNPEVFGDLRDRGFVLRATATTSRRNPAGKGLGM
jgi:hypothetical protein